MTAAMSVVVLYLYRLAVKGSDVNWSKGEEPWDYYRHRQFKIVQSPDPGFSPQPDHATACQAPKYKD